MMMMTSMIRFHRLWCCLLRCGLPAALWILQLFLESSSVTFDLEVQEEKVQNFSYVRVTWPGVCDKMDGPGKCQETRLDSGSASVESIIRAQHKGNWNWQASWQYISGKKINLNFCHIYSLAASFGLVHNLLLNKFALHLICL